MLAASRDLVVADVLQGARSIRYLELENVIQARRPPMRAGATD